MKNVDKSDVVGCENLKTSVKTFCNKCKYINDIGLYFVHYKSLEDVLTKHMAGYSPEELGADAAEEMRKICERRGWKVKE